LFVNIFVLKRENKREKGSVIRQSLKTKLDADFGCSTSVTARKSFEAAGLVLMPLGHTQMSNKGSFA
jgi:hypothetical protein